MTGNFFADLAAAMAPSVRSFASPLSLLEQIDTRIIRTPAIEYLDSHLVDAAEHPEHRKAVSFAPQEGKSTLCARALPLWLLTRNPDLQIAVASYGLDLATQHVQAARDYVLEAGDRLGYSVDLGNAGKSSWSIREGRGTVYAASVTGGFTGKAADVVVVDDPFSGFEDSASPAYRDKVWDWWQGVVSARFSASTVVVVVQTRWHYDDLIGRLLQHDPDGMDFVRVPACADHDPAAGETDPLGREPGEYMVSARGRTTAQWERRRRDAGSKAWAALYQGSPVDSESALIPSSRFVRYHTLMHTESAGRCMVPPAAGDQLVQSWDLAVTGSDTSDYVVGQVWLKRGPNMYLLDQVRQQLSFTDTVEAIKAMSSRWPQAHLKLIEAKANGPAVIDTLRRSTPGLVPVNPRVSKELRATACQPFIEAGNVLLPDAAVAAWVTTLTDELDSFPAGRHDDTVDALTQAVGKLMVELEQTKRNRGLVGVG